MSVRHGFDIGCFVFKICINISVQSKCEHPIALLQTIMFVDYIQTIGKH